MSSKAKDEAIKILEDWCAEHAGTPADLEETPQGIILSVKERLENGITLTKKHRLTKELEELYHLIT